MAIDEKVRFYLRHWEQIEVWAALREPASDAVDAALRAACRQIGAAIGQSGARFTLELDDNEAYPGCLVNRSGWHIGGVTVFLALKWHYAELLDPDGDTWPYAGILLRGPIAELREIASTLRDGLRSHVTALRWDRSEKEWPWWRWIEPGEDVSPEQLAADAASVMVEGWNTLVDPIESIIRTCTGAV